GNGAAYADGSAIPSRYVICFGGHSVGMGYNDPNRPEFSRDEPRDFFVPDVEGPNYDLKVALTPLADYGVQDVVSVISGLRIPYAESDTEPVPTAGVPNRFHGPQYKPLLTGVNAYGGPSPSSDQIVADAIAGNTIFRALNYTPQPATYWYDQSINHTPISVRPDRSFIPYISSPPAALHPPS